MYDILQLNDMLVPELLDIAEQQQITDIKNLEKQELIYKILDKQISMTPSDKKEATTEKPKRKRIVKPAKDEVAEPVAVAVEKEIKPKKIEEKKKPVKKAKEEVVEQEIQEIFAS